MKKLKHLQQLAQSDSHLPACHILHTETQGCRCFCHYMNSSIRVICSQVLQYVGVSQCLMGLKLKWLRNLVWGVGFYRENSQIKI